MLKIPQQTWYQNGDSDTLGTLWLSSNLDLLSNKGKLRVSPRMILNMNDSDDAQLGVPCAIKFFQATRGSIVVIGGTRIFLSASTNGGPSSAFTEEDAGVTPPTDCNADSSDIEDFNSSLYISRASTTMSKLSAGGVWSTVANAFANSSGLHDLEYFRAQNRLYGVDDNAKGISSISTADAVVLSTSGNQYSLNALCDNVTSRISWIRSNSSRIWIGTIRDTGGGYIYAWDGSQASGPNEAYQLEDAGSLGCVIVNNTPVILTTGGKLLIFNGGSFGGLDGEPYLAKFPVENNYFGTFYSTATNMPMHYNGITLIDGEISMLINSTPWAFGPSSDYIERFPSGVWNFSFKNGLYLKNSLGLSKSSATIADFGQKQLTKVGALSFIKSSDNNFNAAINGTYMAGATYYTNATATATGLWYDDFNDTLDKYGFFVTQWIESETIKDNWPNVYARMVHFKNSTDKISIKWRTKEETAVLITGTWVSTTTFNTSTDLRNYVGWEVEGLQGTGSSEMSNISTVTDNGASGWLVTLDEAFTGVTTGTFKGRVQNWTRAGSAFNSQTNDIPDFSLLGASSSSRIQIKVCMHWKNKNELHHLLLDNKKHQ